MNEKENNDEGMISLEIARALVARGWSVVPTESDEENGPALFWHRLEKLGDASALANLHYLDCRYSPSIDYIAAAMREIGDPFKPVLLRKGVSQ